jgi:hypothetical protein
MARYQTVVPQTTTTTTAAVAAPAGGLFTKITGSSTYDVTIGDPALYSGQSQTFYNANTSSVNLKFTTSGGGFFVGPTTPGNSTTLALPTGTVIGLYSDGTNWVVAIEGGGAIAGSLMTLTPTSGITIVSNSTDDSTTAATGAATFAGGIAVNKNISVGKVGNTGLLRLLGSTSGTVTQQASATTTDYALTWPAAAAGTNGFALTSTTGGVLSWTQVTVTLADDTSTATLYPVMSTSATGTVTAAKSTATKFTFNASTGTLTVTAITESSSMALKKNITPIGNALSTILKLKGVTYDRKDGSSTNEAGLIAEHVNKILPNLVSKDAKGKPTGIHYTKLTAYLIEAVKDLQTEIEELTKKLSTPTETKTKGKK